MGIKIKEFIIDGEIPDKEEVLCAIGYIRCNMIRDDFEVYDYGRWNKFLTLKGIKEVHPDVD